MRNGKLTFLLALLLLVLPVTEGLASSGRGLYTVTGTDVNVRSGPGPGYSVVGKSWRIRPIYAVDYHSGVMQRIPGGTSHWLFRRVVLKDMGDSLKELFG